MASARSLTATPPVPLVNPGAALLKESVSSLQLPLAALMILKLNPWVKDRLESYVPRPLVLST